MITRAERKQLYRQFEKRILAGEKKSAIYAPYLDPKDCKIVARILACIPTLENRQQWGWLKWALVGSSCALVIINTILSLKLYHLIDLSPFAFRVGSNVSPIVGIAALILSVMHSKKLYPNKAVFSNSPKRDENGDPIFE